MTSRRLAVTLALAALAPLAAAGCANTTQGRGGHSSGCLPVFFGVAGSGQGLLNPAPPVVPAGESQDDARRYGTTVARLKSELAAIAGKDLASTTPIDYPAIAVNRYLSVRGLTADLDASETQGVATLVTAIHSSYRDSCANRPVLLSGYSQGAEVVVQAVDQLSPTEQQGVSVALFGNPSYEPGRPGDFPGGSQAVGIRPTFRKGAAFALPAEVRARTIDVCAPGDPVCGVDPRLTTLGARVLWVLGHVKIHEDAYAADLSDYTVTAAQFIWKHRAG